MEASNRTELLNQAVEFQQSEQFEEAWEIYSQLLVSSSVTDIEVMSELAMSYIRSGYFGECDTWTLKAYESGAMRWWQEHPKYSGLLMRISALIKAQDEPFDFISGGAVLAESWKSGDENVMDAVIALRATQPSPWGDGTDLGYLANYIKTVMFTSNLSETEALAFVDSALLSVYFAYSIYEVEVIKKELEQLS